ASGDLGQRRAGRRLDRPSPARRQCAGGLLPEERTAQHPGTRPHHESRLPQHSSRRAAIRREEVKHGERVPVKKEGVIRTTSVTTPSAAIDSLAAQSTESSTARPAKGSGKNPRSAEFGCRCGCWPFGVRRFPTL